MIYLLATILPMMVCLLWTVIGLLDYKHADPARRVLALFGVVVTCLYTCHFLHFNGYGSLPGEALYYLCNLSVYPLYALYVRRLTLEQPRFWPYGALWFVPALVVFVLAFFLPSSTILLVDRWVFPVISLGACLVAVSNLVRFRRGVENYYSNPEEKRLDPILVLISLQMVTVAMSFMANLLGRESFVDSNILIVPALVFSLLLFCLFYVGFRTDFPVRDVRMPSLGAPNEGEDASRSFNEVQQQRLLEKINLQMQERELYRTKGLTIAELATAVGSNRTYVSTCINQSLKTSFSDYVNGFRVRYAMEQMKQPGAPSLTEIAEQAGFSDRTSFYRCFKKINGTNPSAWLAQQCPELG